jgi:divalent metal cation (Fe/Co/Zn/Cd) transporter
MAKVALRSSSDRPVATTRPQTNLRLVSHCADLDPAASHPVRSPRGRWASVDPGPGTPAERARLTRRGFWLEYASMAWMTIEAAVAIASGIIASSIALVGFGLDSVIEFFAAAVVVWQLRGGGEERETRAIRLIGVTFFVLAAYLAAESIHDLITRARPGTPLAGIVVSAAALLVMPALALGKRRTGTALANSTLIADAAENAFCALTSAAALLGVGLNAWLGWWWADPAAALVIAALAVREGLEVWEND